MSEHITSETQVAIGDFLKLSDKDKKGKFSYVGEVVGKDGTWIVMNTFEGTMHLKIGADNDLSIGSKPVGWDKFSKNPEKFLAQKIDKEQKAREERMKPIVTQKEKALGIARENPKMAPKKLTKLIMVEVGCSEALAANYMLLARVKK